MSRLISAVDSRNLKSNFQADRLPLDRVYFLGMYEAIQKYRYSIIAIFICKHAESLW